MVSIWLTAVKAATNSSDMKKTGFAKRSRFSSNLLVQESLLPILLDPGGPQAGQTMLIDGKLPGQEFVDGQRVTAAGLLKGEQAAADGSNNLSLTANDPPFGTGRGQVRDCKRAAVRPDDVFYPRAMGFCHGVLTNSQPLNSLYQLTPVGLKIA